MRKHGALRGAVAAACLDVALLAVLASGATAATLNVCVPEKEGAAVDTPKAGVCKPKYNESRLLPQAEAEELEKIKQDIKYVASGVGGKTTIQFAGANVQIVNGEGKTETTNGAGNLVIGYDQTQQFVNGMLFKEATQTGSHNLVLGAMNSDTSYGSVVGGYYNRAFGPETTVFGTANEASGEDASATGGVDNRSTARGSSVSGGAGNVAEKEESSVTGGDSNTASEELSSVTGGFANTAKGRYASVSGGTNNEATESGASVSGGHNSKAGGEDASVSGGLNNEATASQSSVSGGQLNGANGENASVTGGLKDHATKLNSWAGGGQDDEATEELASILGGFAGIESTRQGVKFG
jgi:hypothetical protein